MRISHLAGAVAAPLLLALPSFAQAVQVDEKLPDYEPIQGVSGTIKSVGSDTMNNLMALWGDGFKKFYPSVQTEVEGKGSSTAPPALIEGTANFGPMSRAMKKSEIDEFEREFGYKPLALGTSIDMLAVFVNKDNPIESLSLPEVDAIFSKNRKGGFDSDVRTWGEAGLEGAEWSKQPISLYGRNSASGTYGFFKKKALFKGDYKDDVKEQPGSSGVVQGIASDRYGIGYSGIGYKTADVRAVPISAKAGEKAVAATAENAKAYPLSRALFLYVNFKPNSELDPMRKEFIRYIFSKQGQEDVIKAGYLPVPFTMAKRACAEIGVELKEAQSAEKKEAVEAGSPR